MHPVLEQLADAVQLANEIDWDQQLSTELGGDVLAVQRIEAGVEALVLRVVGAFDQSGSWADDRCRSTAGWLAHFAHLARPAARRQVRHARAVRRMPASFAALVRGELSLDHVAVLARACSPDRAAAFGEIEPVLLEQVGTLPFADFERAVQYWCQLVDPDGAAGDAARRVERRSLHLSRTIDGMGVLDGVLDPLSYAVVSDELERLEQIEFEADWAAARAEHGDAATASHLARTPAQRRADALVRMAERSASTPDGARKPVPVLNLHIDWVTFCAELTAAGRGVRGQLVDTDSQTRAEVMRRPGGGRQPARTAAV